MKQTNKQIPSEARRHSNEREMMAALHAIVFWKSRLSEMEVLLLMDKHDGRRLHHQRGRLRVRFLCDLAFQLLTVTVCQMADIRLLVRHIPGHLNVIADDLSRDRTFPTEWTLAQAVFQRLLARFPPCSWNSLRRASRQGCRCSSLPSQTT